MNTKSKFVLLAAGLFWSMTGFSQEAQIDETAFNETFQASVINQLAIEKERTVQMLDSTRRAEGSGVVFTPEDVVIAQRLQRISKEIPFTYNSQVKELVERYLSRNYKPYMEQLLGLGAYYFPIYDKIFTQQGIPLEARYISVIESSLNPNTVSRSGAVGPWQFMYIAAKGYNLVMDRDYDERKDVYSATYAASSYLNEAYDEFNDWFLAIASFNCGRGCVRRAIEKTGIRQPSFWQVSPHLPRETRNYIPKFIAMTYVLQYAHEYGLSPRPVDFKVDEHQLLMVDRQVSLKRLAEALGYQEEFMLQLNPAYKRGIVDGTPNQPRRLIIPVGSDDEQINDSAVYAALNDVVDVNLRSLADVGAHRVVPGESLRDLADKYQTTVQNLLAWNDLTHRSPIVGRVLRVKPAPQQSPRPDSKAKSRIASAPRYKTYVVKKGDTLSGIASKHKGATVRRLRADNNLRSTRLKIGQRLKIYLN